VRRLSFLALVLAVSACGLAAQAAATVPRDPVPGAFGGSAGEPREAERCRPKSVQPMTTGHRTYAAVVRKRAIAYRSPGKSELARFGPRNVNGVATVFAVLAKQVDRHCGVSWYRVQLPMRPNGSSGWIKAEEVRLQAVRTRLEIDVSERRLTFFRDGRIVLRTTAGTGTAGTPTPTGSYYVNQRFHMLDSSGPFGPGAIGISAFSPVLTDWAQGGPIAVHGTNDPSSVGRAASHGCIRIQNDVLRRILWATATGSPVLIHA
jgi:lipoprotein-anchoring transpeptidase ErfK/SrfK